MLFTSFAQNQPNACEDRTKIFCNLLCVTVLKIPGIFVRKPGKREAKKFIKSREFIESREFPEQHFWKIYRVAQEKLPRTIV